LEQQQIILTVTNDLTTDQRMQRICATLQKAGYQVTLVGRLRSHSIALPHLSFNQHRITCRFEHGPLFYLEYNLKLFVFLLFAKCTIISAVDADTILPCTLAAKIKGKKLVFDAHEYFTEVPELHNRNAIKNIWQTMLKTCIPMMDACYTVGPKLAEIFTNLYGKKFDVIYNMPIKKTLESTSIKKDIILYQGDLNIGRGIEQTITAMQNINAELWIVGDGLLKERIIALITELNLSGKVKLLGKVTPDKLHEITQQAKIGINLLSDVSLSYRYSIANKFFDYVQAGIPSVCANFEEYQTLNKQYEVGVLCDDTVDNIQAAIEHLLTDVLYYQKLVDNCKQAANQWHWETQEKLLVSIYNKVVHW
jgi:glycosyltransferase involved in cell wall biosynthesis